MIAAPKSFGAGRSGFNKALLLAAALASTPSAKAPAADDPAPAGVTNPRRAWQNWTLNCQGCHRPDGSGSPGTAPPLAGTVSKFLTVPGGREYLCRVPGVAASPFDNAELAEVMNWMFWRFDREHIPDPFVPMTAQEIGRLRVHPLRLEATPMREALLKAADAAEAARGAAGPRTPDTPLPKTSGTAP